MTKPPRRASKGRLAASGSEAVESAFMLVKPPMPSGLMQLSAPPQTMTGS